jgi:hypothetical protein
MKRRKHPHWAAFQRLMIWLGIAADDGAATNYRYAWRNTVPHWLGYYWRHHRWVAGLRMLYWSMVRGYISEHCQFCGRPYLTWRAPDALWRELVSPTGGGLSCPVCFDRLAEQHGYTLAWRPFVWMRRTRKGKVRTDNRVFFDENFPWEKR